VGRLPAGVYLAVVGIASLQAQDYVRRSHPQLFSYDELVQLSLTQELSPELSEKLRTVTTTPSINNEAYFRGSGARPLEVSGLGPALRVAFWNIERGLELDNIQLFLTDKDRFMAKVAAERKHAKETRKRIRQVHMEKIPEEIETLKSADVWVRALHGNAVLSRYPIRSARLVPFTIGYDWFKGSKIRPLEKGKGKAAVLIAEDLLREVRRGQRTTLFVDLDVPEAPGQRLTIASTHLENRAKPKIRRAQMEELPKHIQETPHPVIVAGDLNTTGGDSTPTSAVLGIKPRKTNLSQAEKTGRLQGACPCGERSSTWRTSIARW
jgi:endonuclease/exonuclease/phosphatase family metal-dependent hydrolase